MNTELMNCFIILFIQATCPGFSRKKRQATQLRREKQVTTFKIVFKISTQNSSGDVTPGDFTPGKFNY